MFESLRRAISGEPTDRRAELFAERGRVVEALEQRRAMLEDKRRTRVEALFPEGPVPGAGAGRFPDLDPFNFEEAEEQSWLVAVAQRIIDGFPGSEALLSQLDATFRGFSDANHYRVVEGGPWERLLAWRDATLRAWDIEREVPLYLSAGGGARVLGCKEPFVVLDHVALVGLDDEEVRFVLATTLGHLFFGNLRIFSFHRLMEVLDKMPSMSGLIARGLGMIPAIGNTISRGIELARSVNDQVIRKTNMVVGLRQHLLCDRLAALALGDAGPAQRYFVHLVLGQTAAGPDEVAAAHRRLVEQGRALHERLIEGKIDLHMLSIVGPTAAFAAYRAFKLDEWRRDDRSARIARGLYVTRTRLLEYRRSHRALEDEIRFLEGRVLELHERLAKVDEELRGLEAGATEAGVTGAGDEVAAAPPPPPPVSPPAAS
ncbi:MAG: hypothetical protein KIT58_12210 [Planctomycetota bacterium]|nr:hypothetical protein [Planctomycetota bacterium]